jgi:hypothetical protein
MSVARVTELSATSETSFDDAVKEAVARATRTLRGVEGAWRPRGRRGLTQGLPRMPCRGAHPTYSTFHSNWACGRWPACSK